MDNCINCKFKERKVTEYPCKYCEGLSEWMEEDEYCLEEAFQKISEAVKQGEEDCVEYTEDNDKVNHPSHYADGRQYEPIDVISDWELSFCLGNVVKYISRAGRKDDIIQDLEKAAFYLNYEIEHLKQKN